MRVCCVLLYSLSTNRCYHETDVIIQSSIPEIENVLLAAGHQVKVIDYLSAEVSNPDKYYEAVFDFDPDVLCMYSFHNVEDIKHFLLGLNDIPKSCNCIAMGPGAIDVKRVLRQIPSVDYVIPVFPEVIVPKILVSRKCALSDLPNGVAYRDADEIVFTYADRISAEDLFPCIDVQNYISKANPSQCYIRASKGCWYGKCTYCVVGTCYHGENKWREKPYNQLITEIRQLYDKGVRTFNFLDDEFIGAGVSGKEKALRFASEFEKICPEATFNIRARIDTLDQELLVSLRSAGMTAVFVGIESMSDGFLFATRKGFSVQSIREKWSTLIMSGIQVVPGIILAHPCTSLEELQEHIIGLNKLYQSVSYSFPLSMVFHEMHLHAATYVYENFVKRKEATQSEISCEYEKPFVAACIESMRKYGETELAVLDNINKSTPEGKLQAYRIKKGLFDNLLEIINSYIDMRDGVVPNT